MYNFIFWIKPSVFLHVIAHYEYEGEFPNLHALIWLLWISIFDFRGPDWEITIDGKKCYIKELLVELYEKVGFLITLKVNIIRWCNVWLY